MRDGLCTTGIYLATERVDERNSLQQNIVPCNPLSNISSTFLFVFPSVAFFETDERSILSFLLHKMCKDVLLPFSSSLLLYIAKIIPKEFNPITNTVNKI